MTDSGDLLKVYLLCRYAKESSLYNSWLPELTSPYVVVDDCPADWQPPADAGLVITHEHYRWEECHALRRIYEQRRVPLLILADGILEYRNTWQNPTIPDASIYQPLLADKIACIGSASSRMIESWGNPGKTEIVGLPRLDAVAARAIDPIRKQGPFRLLIATATTPAFTPAQRDTVVDALRHLQSYVDACADIEGRPLQVTWRLTDGLADDLQLVSPDESPATLIEAVEMADAVITTPSTIYLESAMLNRPVAILDFSNSPPWVASAWNMTAADHIPTGVAELADPPPAKMMFQEYSLHDNLHCRGSATSRMIELISRMMQIGADQRRRHQPLSMPARLLPFEPDSVAANALKLEQWYPQNTAFQIQETARLQAELSQAIARLDTCPRDLADKNRQITQLQAALNESRRRLADVRSRLFKLRKILGIGKENQPDESDP